MDMFLEVAKAHPLIVAGSIFAFVALMVVRVFGRQIRGRIGEGLLSSFLRRRLDPDRYEILDDVYLPDGTGGTTQIDHIVVSRSGVFVIETKTYRGWIFGGEGHFWTQSMRGGCKNKFQNPLRQNYKHVCVLRDCCHIPKEHLKSIVAFSGEATFKGDIADRSRFPEVMHFASVVDHIHSFVTPLFTEEQARSYADAIRESSSKVTPEQRRAHVANLRARH